MNRTVSPTCRYWKPEKQVFPCLSITGVPNTSFHHSNVSECRVRWRIVMMVTTKNDQNYDDDAGVHGGDEDQDDDDD